MRTLFRTKKTKKGKMSTRDKPLPKKVAKSFFEGMKREFEGGQIIVSSDVLVWALVTLSLINIVWLVNEIQDTKDDLKCLEREIKILEDWQGQNHTCEGRECYYKQVFPVLPRCSR